MLPVENLKSTYHIIFQTWLHIPPRCSELGLNPGQTQTKLVPGVELGHENTNASTSVKIKQAANQFKKNLEESKKDDKKGMDGPVWDSADHGLVNGYLIL